VETLNLVIAGHVDHGKSTIVGRLLADTHSLPDGKLEAVKLYCQQNSKPFEYAFLLDALKDEQSQGITIDAARAFFKTNLRKYLLIDAPGHIEFLKNMITGASWAEAALLVIDANEGIMENSRRHGFMLSFLGIRQIAVLVNKMDLIGFDQTIFENILEEYSAFLDQIGVQAAGFIPVSGMEGDNVAVRSASTPWYHGPTVLEQLDRFTSRVSSGEKPFRFLVQDVYKFTNNGDSRRIVAGSVESGQLRVGQDIVFYPSCKKSTVRTIESFSSNGNINHLQELETGWSAGFTLAEQIYIQRGEIAGYIDEKKPYAASRMRVSLFWLSREPLVSDKKYLFKLGTSKTEMEVESILRVFDASTLESKEASQVQRNDVADCILKLDKMIAFDLSNDLPETGRFVIVDNYEISGGGVILEGFEEKDNWIKEKAQTRNIRWEKSEIGTEQRAERYNQKSCLILITGAASNIYRKELSKQLEKRLFTDGKFTYYIGTANLLYGIDADMPRDGKEVHTEHFRRLAEVANLMLDAGIILIVSARDVTDIDLQILKSNLMDRAERIITIWAGDNLSPRLTPQLQIGTSEMSKGVSMIKQYLRQQGYIFNFE